MDYKFHIYLSISLSMFSGTLYSFYKVGNSVTCDKMNMDEPGGHYVI
jgi:hypothetical protein